MKQLKCLVKAVLVILFCTGISVAAERATKEECIVKVKEAATMIKEQGRDAVFEKITDRSGPFIWKGSYVFAMDNKEAIFFAHPYLPPNMIGNSMIDWADKNGKMFMREILDVANTKGEGWVNYYVRRSGTREQALRQTFVYKVPGEDLIVGAGLFMEE